MAVTVDQASLGTAAGTVTASVTFATTAAVASGGMLVVLIGVFSAGLPAHTVSGGGLTWAQAHTSTSGSLRVSLWYAFAAAGLASGTNLTAGPGSGSHDITVCSASYLGVSTSGTVTGFNAAAASTAAWATGTIAGASGDAYIGGAFGDGTLRTSTPTSPAVERVDFNSATTSGSVTLVDKLSGSASDNLAGTWSGTLGHIGLGASFLPAAGGGGPTVKHLAALGVG